MTSTTKPTQLQRNSAYSRAYRYALTFTTHEVAQPFAAWYEARYAGLRQHERPELAATWDEYWPAF